MATIPIRRPPTRRVRRQLPVYVPGRGIPMADACSSSVSSRCRSHYTCGLLYCKSIISSDQ